ncbi:putative succinate dehydrogenase membrane anchor subunit [Phaeomoniella chlamydospora]|uniref:Succinate dehydrogenase [ubiquinone] cytochrome b small subunit n=1 Tax=Phaeomoniella chlamydospora TaxID=158046 RepID=A0A0G2ETU0_PHACM|nr:putative succinate dehydrogenase membrane anchor subunit [Phaeomoniella chlamydospora]
MLHNEQLDRIEAGLPVLCQTRATIVWKVQVSLTVENARGYRRHKYVFKRDLGDIKMTDSKIANDPAPVPHAEPMHGSYHWSFERLIAVALVPLTVAPFAAGTLNPTLDALFVGTLLIHSHIGFQSMIIDYIPWKKYPLSRKVFWWGLRLATLTVAVGFYEFETHDVGLTEAIKRVWVA